MTENTRAIIKINCIAIKVSAVLTDYARIPYVFIGSKCILANILMM